MGVLHTYALSPAALRRLLARSQARLLVVVSLSYAAFAVFLLLNPRPVDLKAVFPVVLVTTLAYFFILFVNYRIQLRLLYSVRVDLDGASIAYRQEGLEPQRVMRGSIARAIQRKDGLLVETADPRYRLLIPAGLTRDGDQAVRTALQAWVGITPQAPRRSPEPYLTIFGLVTGLVVLVFANSLWIVIPLAVFIFLWGFYQERRLMRSPHVDPGILRMYNSALGFLLFVIAMKSCILLLLVATANSAGM